MKDEHALSNYNIQSSVKQEPQSTIHLVIKEGEPIEIFVKAMDKEVFSIRLEKANGLEAPEGLKAKIQNKVNIPLGHQILIFDKRMLGSGFKINQLLC